MNENIEAVLSGGIGVASSNQTLIDALCVVLGRSDDGPYYPNLAAIEAEALGIIRAHRSKVIAAHLEAARKRSPTSSGSGG